MKLLIIDTETTSATENTAICEIAGTLYQIGETERQTGALSTFATLLPVNDNPAEMINSIAHELVSYENRHLASRAKFSWDDQRRIWVKKIRECDREKFVASLDFGVEQI